MKKIIILYLALILAIWLGVRMVNDPGYVLIAYGMQTIEMSVWTACFFVALLFLLTYMLLNFVIFLGSFSGRFHDWLTEKRLAQSHSLTTMGLIEYTEGKWKSAEKHLLQAVANSENPVVNYLAAARAAQEQGSPGRRDRYLQKAQKIMPSAKIAVDLAQSQLQFEAMEYEKARTTLLHLRFLDPTHPHVLKLLQRVYVLLGDWGAFIELFPDLKRYKILPKAELENLESEAYLHFITEQAIKTDTSAYVNAWHRFPYHIRKTPSVVAAYVRGLLAKQEQDLAEKELYAQLQRDLDDECLRLYGLTHARNDKTQLRNAERWVSYHPNHAMLLLTLGRLCRRFQLWGKARTYLENSLANEPMTETYVELAELLEKLGEKQLAADYYRQGLQQASQKC